MSRYIALAHRGETGSWGISFPDFPGCISAADSFEDLVERGAAALQFHVEGLLEDGEAVPEPRPLEALRADREFVDDFDGAIVTVVPLLPPLDRPMRVNVILDAKLLASIDRTAEQLGLNRSEFLAEGARRLIVAPEQAKRAAGTELSGFSSPKAKQYTVQGALIGEPIRHVGRDERPRSVEAAVGHDRPPPSDRPRHHKAGRRVIKGMTKGTTKKR